MKKQTLHPAFTSENKTEIDKCKSKLLKTSETFIFEEETPGEPWNDSEFYFAKPVKIASSVEELAPKKDISEKNK